MKFQSCGVLFDSRPVYFVRKTLEFYSFSYFDGTRFCFYKNQNQNLNVIEKNSPEFGSNGNVGWRRWSYRIPPRENVLKYFMSLL